MGKRHLSLLMLVALLVLLGCTAPPEPTATSLLSLIHISEPTRPY